MRNSETERREVTFPWSHSLIPANFEQKERGPPELSLVFIHQLKLPLSHTPLVSFCLCFFNHEPQHPVGKEDDRRLSEILEGTPTSYVPSSLSVAMLLAEPLSEPAVGPAGLGGAHNR